MINVHFESTDLFSDAGSIDVTYAQVKKDARRRNFQSQDSDEFTVG